MGCAVTSTLIYEELLDNPAVKEVTPEELRIGMQIIGNRAILSAAKDAPDLANLIANGELRVDSIDHQEVDKSRSPASVGARVSASSGVGAIDLHFPYDAPVLVWSPRLIPQRRPRTSTPSENLAKAEVFFHRSLPPSSVLTRRILLRRLLDR
jgi:hypothetical protein